MGIANKYKVLCKVGDVIISYHKGLLYKQNDMTEKHSIMMPLPAPLIKRILQKIRILERLLRLEPRIAIPLNAEEILLSYQGTLYRINCVTNQMVVDHKLRKTMNNPLSFCINGNTVLYGEYFRNDQHDEVSIYMRDNNRWEKVFSFKAGEVLHIHQVVFDKYRNCYWIQTGDSDSESGIWQADLKFEHVVPVFKGKQMYRSCFLVPMTDCLVFTTDTPLEKNYIFISNELEFGVWDEPRVICEIPGPCIYGSVIDDNHIAIATSVEPDPTLPTLRYRISYKLGGGVKDRFSHILIGNPKAGFKDIHKGRKDLWPMNIFQFGNYQFPYMEDETFLYVTGQSIWKEDGKTVSIDI